MKATCYIVRGFSPALQVYDWTRVVNFKAILAHFSFTIKIIEKKTFKMFQQGFLFVQDGPDTTL